jgi:DNA-binding transcriptional regulator GbsR (MarR family)
MGLAFESDGFTRIGGRLFGHLLLADRPLSLDELADALGASKASVSTDARRLLDKGVVERSGRPGDRRDYWKIAPDFFASLMQHRVERWRRLDALVGELKRRAPVSSPAVRARLRYMEDVYAYIAGRVDEALESWQARRAVKPRRPRAAAKTRKRGRAA